MKRTLEEFQSVFCKENPQLLIGCFKNEGESLVGIKGISKFCSLEDTGGNGYLESYAKIHKDEQRNGYNTEFSQELFSRLALSGIIPQRTGDIGNSQFLGFCNEIVLSNKPSFKSALKVGYQFGELDVNFVKVYFPTAPDPDLHNKVMQLLPSYPYTEHAEAKKELYSFYFYRSFQETKPPLNLIFFVQYVNLYPNDLQIPPKYLIEYLSALKKELDEKNLRSPGTCYSQYDFAIAKIFSCAWFYFVHGVPLRSHT